MAKQKNQTPKQAASKFIQSAQAFEKTRITSIKRSNKIAWTITTVSILMALMAVGAVMLLTPLKTVEPYVLRVDKNTGVVDIVTTLKDAQNTYDEATDRYWLSQYIRYREGYDWWTVQSQYDASMLLSGSHEQRIIAEFFDSDVAPYKVFKDRFRVDIKIISISWIDNVAQVRFEKTVKPLNDSKNQKPEAQRLIATIGYQYLNTPQNQADRLINPLGLQVMSYRVDPEG